jgi:FAD/FMN-containing dehydrogenase
MTPDEDRQITREIIPNQSSPRRRKSLLAVLLLIASIFLFVVDKLFEYASAPIKVKNCDFVFPAAADQTKLTSIIVRSATQPPAFEQFGGFINDASCLNKTAIYGIVEIFGVEDIRNALRFARENSLKVTMAGQRHSMGGQSFTKDGLVLDMRAFKQLKLDKAHKILNVQTGATWAQIQRLLDQQGLAVKAMQSINIFTVGGALSVNAHGIAHDPGQLAPTVRAIRVMLSDGEIKTASRTENSELFRLALGGYGLFGVILDADLDVVDNEVYKWNSKYLDYKDFPGYYVKNVEGNRRLGLAYGRLSISPGSYLQEAALHTFEKTDFEGPIEPIRPPGYDWLDRFIINFSKTGSFGRWTRWQLEKYVGPRVHPCLSRNERMSREEGCLVSRNEEMYDSMDYLKNRLKDTDILQEYFVPPGKMADFVDGLRDVVTKNHANLLNVTIRIVHRDTVTALPYARQDMFAFVLYFNQKLNETESQRLQSTTADLIDLALRVNGTYYLPYQLFYSQQQLHQAYPEIDAFFLAKKTYDPIGLFSNKFYEKFGQ